MDFGEIILCVFGVIILAIIAHYFFRKPSAEEMEYKNKMEESIKDTYIIDPETGAKLTLEQAASGIWNENEVDYYNPDEDPLVDEDYFKIQDCINLLKKEKEYQPYEFDEEAIHLIESTNMFQKYKDWYFFEILKSDKYKRAIGFLKVTMGQMHIDRTEQLFYWLQGVNFTGHYHLYEVSKSEKTILNLSGVKPNYFNDYYCEIITKTAQEQQVFNLFEWLSTTKSLEIELIEDNLFIKTKRQVCQEDIATLEKLVAKFQ